MISEGVGLVAGDVNATSWRKFNHGSFEVDRAPLPSTKLGPANCGYDREQDRYRLSER